MRTYWEEQAANELKALLKWAGMTYAQLAEALAAQGSDVTTMTLTKRLYRGAFTHSFFMQCADIARRHHEAEARRATGAPVVSEVRSRASAANRR